MIRERVGRGIALALIGGYQRTISPDHGLLSRLRGEPFCFHEPTCSEYGRQAIERHGLRDGLRMTWARLRRCGRGAAVDPVPEMLHAVDTEIPDLALPVRRS